MRKPQALRIELWTYCYPNCSDIQHTLESPVQTNLLFIRASVDTEAMDVLMSDFDSFDLGTWDPESVVLVYPPLADIDDGQGTASSEVHTAKAPRQRSKVLPERDWTRLRPIITKLYIDEERSLKYIQSIMAREQGFNAT